MGTTTSITISRICEANINHDSQQLHYRLGDPANEGNSDINLVSWWKYGESILVADGDVPEPKPLVNEFWSPPKVWSLIDQTWTVLEYQQ